MIYDLFLLFIITNSCRNLVKISNMMWRRFFLAVRALVHVPGAKSSAGRSMQAGADPAHWMQVQGGGGGRPELEFLNNPWGLGTE